MHEVYPDINCLPTKNWFALQKYITVFQVLHQPIINGLPSKLHRIREMVAAGSNPNETIKEIDNILIASSIGVEVIKYGMRAYVCCCKTSGLNVFDETDVDKFYQRINVNPDAVIDNALFLSGQYNDQIKKQYPTASLFGDGHRDAHEKKQFESLDFENELEASLSIIEDMQEAFFKRMKAISMNMRDPESFLNTYDANFNKWIASRGIPFADIETMSISAFFSINKMKVDESKEIERSMAKRK